jgi:hypothetical protein
MLRAALLIAVSLAGCQRFTRAEQVLAYRSGRAVDSASRVSQGFVHTLGRAEVWAGAGAANNRAEDESSQPFGLAGASYSGDIYKVWIEAFAYGNLDADAYFRLEFRY